LAVGALRTFHANEILLDVLAVRISAARNELTITPVAQHQIAAAFRAELFQRNTRHTLALVQPAGGLPIRIASKSHELPKAPALQDHHASAVLAVFVLPCLGHLRAIKV